MLKIENYPTKTQYYKAVRLSFEKYDQSGKIFTTTAKIDFCPYCQKELEVQAEKRIMNKIIKHVQPKCYWKRTKLPIRKVRK